MNLWTLAQKQADNLQYISDKRAKRQQQSMLLNTLISALKAVHRD